MGWPRSTAGKNAVQQWQNDCYGTENRYVLDFFYILFARWASGMSYWYIKTPIEVSHVYGSLALKIPVISICHRRQGVTTCAVRGDTVCVEGWGNVLRVNCVGCGGDGGLCRWRWCGDGGS